MNEGLFEKYKKVLSQKADEKETVCILIKNETGVLLSNNEIQIDNKKVTLHVSSVKKAVLQQKKITHILQQNGYYVSF
jgi:hypothetical protein